MMVVNMYSDQFLAFIELLTLFCCNICIFSCQDEADVFPAVSHIGRNHKKFVAIVSKEVFEEVNLFL